MTGAPISTVMAWDTSTSTTSAALVKCPSGRPWEPVRVVAETALGSATHSKNLFPALKDLLAQASMTIAEVDLLAVGLGPGSFTGLRVGLAAAQGLSWGAAKPAVGLNSLEVMAHQAAQELESDEWLIVPIMDARHQELFGALYRQTPAGLVRLGDYLALAASALENLVIKEAERRKLRPALLGPGADLINPGGARRLSVEYPSAAVLAGRARLVSPARNGLRPCYLRPPAIRPGHSDYGLKKAF